MRAVRFELALVLGAARQDLARQRGVAVLDRDAMHRREERNVAFFVVLQGLGRQLAHHAHATVGNPGAHDRRDVFDAAAEGWGDPSGHRRSRRP